MDRVLEENVNRHALLEQREMALKWRNIGIGIMGMSEMLVKLGFKYGDPDSIGTMRNLMKFIFRESVIISAANGRIYGSFPGYDPKVWDSTIIRNAFSDEEITELRKQNTLRNCSLLSIAPTGSIATLLGLGGTGCEPFFALSFNRKTDNLNGTYKVELDIVKEYRKIWANDEDLPSFFATSKDIPWKERIDMQAALQEFCDSGISSTVNLPKETTIEDIKDLYIYAWKKGCKGITVYREGSRDPVLFTKSKNKEVTSNKINTNPNFDELKRGDIIPINDHWLGLKRTLSTGCGSLHVNSYWDPDSGELRECFLSKGSTGGCQLYMIGLSRMISLAARGGISIDNILDQLGSCGVCPSYAVKTITKGDTSKGSCCPVAVGNALKDMYNEIQEIICECKENNSEMRVIRAERHNTETGESFVKEVSSLEECPNCHEKTLAHSNGCVQCPSCGWSRCS